MTDLERQRQLLYHINQLGLKSIFEVTRVVYYRPQRSWGKVIFSQASVILLTGGCFLRGGASSGGGCFLWGVLPPWGGTSSQGGPGGDPLGRLLLRAVRILLECILVKKSKQFNPVMSAELARIKFK